jgi:hypothetical protein
MDADYCNPLYHPQHRATTQLQLNFLWSLFLPSTQAVAKAALDRSSCAELEPIMFFTTLEQFLEDFSRQQIQVHSV